MPTFNLGRPVRLALQGSTSYSGAITFNGAAIANTVTLSGPTTGSAGTADTFTVTPNGTIGSTVIVTPAATNAGSVIPTTLTFATAETAAKTFAVTRASAGTSSITITNNGGLTNAGSPISYTTTAEPTWSSTVPTFTFAQGTSSTQSLVPYTTNFNSSLHQFSLTTGALPTGVTLNQSDGYAYNGTSPVASASGLIVTIVDNAAADFAARSVGALYAENWSSYADATAAFNSNSCWRNGTSKTPAQGSSFTNSFEIITTPSHVLSGKALRLWHGKNDFGGSGYIDNQYWAMIFAGGNTTANAIASYKTKVYVQFIVWVDDFFNYQWKKAVANGGNVVTPKAIVIDYESGSATRGEMVVDNQENRGFVTVYRYTDTESARMISKPVSTPFNSSNFQWQNAVDRGGATPSTQNQWERRYGPCYDGMTGGTSQGSLLSTQGVPDPDAAIGGIAWNRGGFTVVECELDLPNDRLRMWAAHRGNAPTLTNDTLLDSGKGGLASVGTRAKTLGTGWNAVYLSNLAYQADWGNNPGAPLSYTDYVEIIFSTSPINFPGGYALPGV